MTTQKATKILNTQRFRAVSWSNDSHLTCVVVGLFAELKGDIGVMLCFDRLFYLYKFWVTEKNIWNNFSFPHIVFHTEKRFEIKSLKSNVSQIFFTEVCYLISCVSHISVFLSTPWYLLFKIRAPRHWWHPLSHEIHNFGSHFRVHIL